MEHGPVLSEVLDFLNGKRSDVSWKRRITPAASDTHLVHLVGNVPDNLLSESEKQSLCLAHEIFSKMTKQQLEKYCHDNFHEWENPGKSSKPISYEILFKEIGKPAGFAEDMEEMQKDEDHLLQLLA